MIFKSTFQRKVNLRFSKSMNLTKMERKIKNRQQTFLLSKVKEEASNLFFKMIYDIK